MTILVLLAIAIAILGKSADVLVEAAVELSKKLGIPTVIVGATILSLGTTTPEAVVSVMAAIRGNPGLAMGNAAGSIICDTGLILGIAAIIGPLKIDFAAINKTAWIQLACGVALALFCLPFGNIGSVFTTGGNLSQSSGWIFIVGLIIYMAYTIRAAQNSTVEPQQEEEGTFHSTFFLIGKILLCLVFVILSSELLIHCATELAKRMSIPDSVIAATLVAFGTSLPELITALMALKRHQSELAVGNIIGADILNVLFVAGAAASVTPGGLDAPGHFFTMVFPSMIAILVCFRILTYFSKPVMPRWGGFILVAFYVIITVLSFTSAT